MVERTQPDASRTRPNTANKATFAVAGTVIALLIAGIGVQIIRATPGITGEESPKTQMTDAPRYLARVNGVLVTWEDVAQESIDRYGRDVLENVINRTLIQQSCAERKIEVTTAEVDQEILRISKRFGLDMPTWYKMIQAERGLNPVQYRRDIIWPMLALKKLAGQKVHITERMIDREYVDRFGEKVKARMIMLDNLRRAQAVWDKVNRNPDEFERYARKDSIETNSRALGGSMPPIRRYSGHEKVREAAFKMKHPGEVSGIIHVGPSRYVILKYEGRTERIDHEKKDVQAEIHAELIEREVQKLVATTFKMLKEESRIDNYLTGESTVPIQQVSAQKQTSAPSANSRRRGSVAQTSSSKKRTPRLR